MIILEKGTKRIGTEKILRKNKQQEKKLISNWKRSMEHRK